MLTTTYSKTGIPFEAFFDGKENRLLGRIKTDAPKMAVRPFSEYLSNINAPVLDVTKLQPYDRYQKNVPILDQDGLGACCLVKGSLVRMADGSSKPIEDVKLLDKVLTAEGNIGIVTKTFARKANSIFNIHAYGHKELKLTGEHPVLTERGYVDVMCLSQEDWIAIPRFVPSTKVKIDTAKYYKETRSIKLPVCDTIYLDKQSGRIFGLYLTKGYTTNGALCWDFNINEKDTLAPELVNLLKEQWDLDAKIEEKTYCNSVVVRVFSENWCRLFVELFGEGSANKRVHHDLMSGSAEFLESMLDGWLDGDGYYNDKTVIDTTVSRALANDMFNISSGVGRRFTIKSKQRYNKDGSPEKRVWELSEDVKDSGDDHRFKMDDKYVWRKFIEATEESYNDYVFNLHVEGDNSYVAEGIGVHNCGHSHATMLMKARDSAGYTFQALSADSLYAQVNGGHDGGSDPADCITALEQNGICLLSEVPDSWVLWQNIPQSAKDNAKRFRIVAAGVYQCANFAECVTADYLGFSVTFTIKVGANFGPNSDYVVGFSPGYANHCVASAERFRIQNGVPQLGMRNSWGTGWGDKGCAWATARHLDEQPGLEAYALMWSLEDPQDPNGNIPKTIV